MAGSGTVSLSPVVAPSDLASDCLIALLVATLDDPLVAPLVASLEAALVAASVANLLEGSSVGASPPVVVSSLDPSLESTLIASPLDRTASLAFISEVPLLVASVSLVAPFPLVASISLVAAIFLEATLLLVAALLLLVPDVGVGVLPCVTSSEVAGLRSVGLVPSVPPSVAIVLVVAALGVALLPLSEVFLVPGSSGLLGVARLEFPSLHRLRRSVASLSHSLGCLELVLGYDHPQILKSLRSPTEILLLLIAGLVVVSGSLVGCSSLVVLVSGLVRLSLVL